MVASYEYQKSTEFYMGMPGRRAVYQDKEEDALFVKEQKHAKGAWISVIVETRTYRDRTAYWVAQRGDRRQCMVERLHDEPFYEEDEATVLFQTILDNTEHDKVRKPHKRLTPRDSQRDRVYQWENKFHNPFLSEHLTPEQSLTFVKELCSITGERMVPKVTFPESEYAICALKGRTHMQIPPSMRRRDALIHEFAHYIAGNHAWVLKQRIAAHGPEFVGYFMLMLEKIGGVDMDDMQAHAIARGVKFKFPEKGTWTSRFLSGLEYHSYQKVAA